MFYFHKLSQFLQLLITSTWQQSPKVYVTTQPQELPFTNKFIHNFMFQVVQTRKIITHNQPCSASATITKG